MTPVERAQLKDILTELNRNHRQSQIWLFKAETSLTTVDAMAAMEVGYTNAFDSVDTTTLHLVSSSADDAVAGPGCTEVTVVGVKSNAFHTKAIAMAGASHAHINDGTWDRLIGMYASAGTPVGNIVLDVHATGTVYCTIAATQTYSVTTKVWVPTGFTGAVVSVIPIVPLTAAATFVVADGAMVGIDINGTVQTRYVGPENIGKEFCQPMPFNLPITGEKYMSIQIGACDTDLHGTPTIIVTYLIWET